MRTVGELFGRGEMQLPFVLQSAEVMKAAVTHLEPHLDRADDDDGKGTLVLATVKGDVHDIGKNLVDIILSNNGYKVINLGIKQPISAIIRAAEEAGADAVGMSGLLVKSTVVMKENLQEMNARDVARRWPVILGGAALTRAYVETDLAEVYDGEVRYARDAFEGLRLMDAISAVKHGVPGASLPPLRPRRVRGPADDGAGHATDAGTPARSDVARGLPVPTPPFWGDRVVKGIQLAYFASYLDERATFIGQWGLRRTRGGDGPGYDDLVETEGRPRLRMWLERAADRRPAPGRRRLRLLPGRLRGLRPGDPPPRGRRHRRRPRHRPRPFHLPPPAPGPAPVPGRLLPLPRRGRAASAAPTSSPSSWSRWARRSPARPRSCSPPTPTATTWSCTACPSS